MGEHWTEEELIYSCYLYLNKDLTSQQKFSLALTVMGRNRNQMNFRFGNIKTLDKGEGGFSKGGESLRKVWEQFKSDPEGMMKKARYLEEHDLIKNPSVSDLEEADMIKLPPGEYIERKTKQRVHQKELREKMLQICEGKCCLTGISEPTMLITSHIKRWSDGDGEERTDLKNVLCLNAFHDSLFNSYRMTIDEDMNVIYDPELEKTIPKEIYD